MTWLGMNLPTPLHKQDATQGPFIIIIIKGV